MDLQLARTDTLVARRHRLTALLRGAPALVPAGAPTPRNYPANTYEFRAGSHFLYLAGLPLPGAMLWLDGEQATIFLPAPAPDDELWHGRVPSFGAIADATGCKVRAIAELAIDDRPVATLPAVDLASRLEQERALGRALEPRTEADDRLIDAMVALRLVHDGAAIAELREAAEGTAAAHRAGMAATRAGARESAIRAAMEAECLSRGMSTAYGSIVTVHGEVLHNHAYGNTLRVGDLLLCDVGAESRGGWAGDVTRTWPVSGKFSPTQREIYDVVLRGQHAAIERARAGVRYRDVHLAAARSMTADLIALGVFRGDADELVADGVHALLFPHGVGHLLGLDVHDMEDLGDRAGYAPGRTRSAQFGLSYLRLDRDLAPGMAVTIEPGIYQVPAILNDARLTAMAGDRLDRTALERFSDVRGIRIEDDVLITDGDPDILTRVIPKTVSDVEAAVG